MERRENDINAFSRVCFWDYVFVTEVDKWTMDFWTGTGAREPWRQSRRGSHKISPNGAKIGLGSHKFSEVIH